MTRSPLIQRLERDPFRTWRRVQLVVTIAGVFAAVAAGLAVAWAWGGWWAL